MARRLLKGLKLLGRSATGGARSVVGTAFCSRLLPPGLLGRRSGLRVRSSRGLGWRRYSRLLLRERLRSNDGERRLPAGRGLRDR